MKQMHYPLLPTRTRLQRHGKPVYSTSVFLILYFVSLSGQYHNHNVHITSPPKKYGNFYFIRIIRWLPGTSVFRSRRCFSVPWRYKNREIECSVKAQDEYRSLHIDRSVGILHHLSYVRSDDDLKRKMESFSHSTEKQVNLHSLFETTR